MENQELQHTKKKSFYDSWAFLILLCVVVPILFRSLLFAPFHIPSGSMKSTLLVGDFIFVSKFSYGYSRFSFPLGYPFFHGRIGSGRPDRGDVAVFRPPPNPQIDFIKRVVGLPGDTVQMKNSRLYINGQLVPRKRIEDFIATDAKGNSRVIKQYIETLPGGVSHRVLDDDSHGPLDNTRLFKVPEGHYFMMGDNRDHSSDSRTTTVGFVPEENLVGKANIIFISTASKLWKFWTWGEAMRGERFFTGIHSAPEGL